VSVPSEIKTVAADALPPGRTAAVGGVEVVNPLEVPDWDAMLLACPTSSIFHSTAWARVLLGTYGYKPVYFIRREAGRLRALLAVMEVDSWLTGRRGVSLPFTDDCEPLCLDGGGLDGVVQKMLDYATERDWKYLECRGGKRLFANAPASTSFYGHQLGLLGGDEALFAKVESAVRRAVRKAEKAGVTVEFGQSLDAMRTFYDLHCKTRGRHGLPPQPFQFFQNIHEHVVSKNHGFVVIARHQQVPVASNVYFHWGKNVIYKYGASDETYQQLRANNLVMWEAIRWYGRHNYEQLHFGRTSLNNQGLRRFKLGWGTAEHSIEYVRFDRRKKDFVTVKDESSGWHSYVFNRMPGFVSKWVGSVLYKHMA
jgi:Acetyltransferase (GNAT) domain